MSPIFAGESYVGASDANFAEGEGASWAIAWAESGGEGESFVNLIPTALGGTHEAGLRNAVWRIRPSLLRSRWDGRSHRSIPCGPMTQLNGRLSLPIAS